MSLKKAQKEYNKIRELSKRAEFISILNELLKNDLITPRDFEKQKDKCIKQSTKKSIDFLVKNEYFNLLSDVKFMYQQKIITIEYYNRLKDDIFNGLYRYNLGGKIDSAIRVLKTLYQNGYCIMEGYSKKNKLKVVMTNPKTSSTFKIHLRCVFLLFDIWKFTIRDSSGKKFKSAWEISQYLKRAGSNLS